MSSFDLIGYGPDGVPTVVVEAKNLRGTSREWAAELRQNLLQYDTQRSALFALIVPDHIYTWRAAAPPDALPDEDIDARPVLRPYFQRAGVTPRDVRARAFEELVAWWLEDMARAGEHAAKPKLRKSGLLDAVKGARIVREVAA